MIIDGKKIAEEVRTELRAQIAQLPRPLTLGFVRSGTDLVAKKFVAMKSRAAESLGIQIIEIPLSEQPTTDEAIAAVELLAKKTDGIIVQMPLPSGVDLPEVLRSVPADKDVDATSGGEQLPVLAPVTGAVREILERSGVSVRGKKAVVVGHGRLVGKPTARWLSEAGAQVTLLTRDSGDLGMHTKQADIIVLGAGKANILTPDMIADGVVIIDAGTTESEGEVRGDADARCAEKAALFTPVPGGVGPVAVAMIFKNLFALAEAKK